MTTRIARLVCALALVPGLVYAQSAEVYIPLVVSGGGRQTTLTLTNPGQMPAEVQVQRFSAEGAEMEAVTLTLAPQETREFQTASDGPFVTSWARVRSQAGPLAGAMRVQTQITWPTVLDVPAAVPDQSIHLRLDGNQPGVVIVNPHGWRADLTVALRDASGTVVASAPVSLDGGHQLLGLLQRVLPGAALLSGSVELQSSVPIVAFSPWMIDSEGSGLPGPPGPAGPQGPEGAPGTTNHSDLTNLGADDHPQYLRTDGARPLIGNLSAAGHKIVQLAPATGPGEAVRYEQAVKQGETASGDLSGAYPSPTVDALQGRAVSGAAPVNGQVLAWSGNAWEPTTSVTGASDHGALTGLTDDDHPQYLLAGVRDAIGGFAVTGTPGSGAIPVEGAGARMMWFPGSSAFRAGKVESFGSTYWDAANVGSGSAAFGENTRATGANSFAANLVTTASGNESVALGSNGTASADRAFAFNGTAAGVGAVAIGSGAQATGDDAIAFGPSSISGGLASVTIGPSIANASFAVAIGLQNQAAGNFTVALGKNACTGRVHSEHTAGHPSGHFSGSVVISDASAAFASDAVHGTANNQIVARGTGGIVFYTSMNLSSGVEVPAGGGAWSSLSDRNAKENFATIDGNDVLRRLRSVPVTSWNYRSQDAHIRHIGPVAQDFYAAFGVGEDERRINAIDIDGVNLAAVQALDTRTTEQQSRIDALEREIAEARENNEALEARIRRLEQLLASRGSR